MKKYTYKEVANIVGIQTPNVYARVKKASFPKEYMTTIVNDNNQEVKALTEEGLQLLKEEYQVTDSKVSEENKNLLGNLELVKQGDFLGTKCDFYKDTNDNIYMTREQIADALQYKTKTALVNLHQKYKKSFDNMSIQISRFSKVVSKQHHLEGDINNIHQNDVGNNNIRQNVGDFKPSDSKGLKVVTNDDHLESPKNTQSDTLLYNEDGVYEITFLSRQPRAEEFRAWVRERIKEIRKYGFTTQTNEDGTHNVQAMAEFLHGKEESVGKLAFIALAEWKIKATMELAKQKDLITVQNEELNKQKPKVQFAEQVAGSNDVISVNAMAKLLHKNGIDIGQNRLYEWLRENKLVMRMKQNKQWVNVPTQMAVDKGFLSIEETTFTDKYGKQRISAITRVTPKGQYVILNKFLSNNGVMN